MVVLLVGFFPVHETVLAPAEIVAADPFVVAAPIDGIVANMRVQPNQVVKSGEVLFQLEATVLKGKRDIAKMAFQVARADYQRAARKAFNDTQSKAQLAELKATMDERKAEVVYAQSLLERITVHAPRAGIVMFDDPNDWLGRPVATGERVMLLAEPTNTQVQAWVSVDDAVNLELGARMLLFLDTDPTHPLEAKLSQTAYEPRLTPEQVMAFRVKARFEEGIATPRIGLQGTAKIYDERVSLAYYLFRRPYAAARQWLGW